MHVCTLFMYKDAARVIKFPPKKQSELPHNKKRDVLLIFIHIQRKHFLIKTQNNSRRSPL